jgi:hypothetical protein
MCGEIMIWTISVWPHWGKNMTKKLYLLSFFQLVYILFRNRDSSVRIMSDYGLDNRGSIPDRGRGFVF